MFELETFEKLFWDKRKKIIDDDNIYQVDIFNKLCEKAKSLIWEELQQNNTFYLDVAQLEDYVLDLTPIEQILFFAFDIYQYNAITKDCFFNYSVQPQSHIKCDVHNYIADFLIEDFVLLGEVFECKKKIVIECDGYDSHHTKQQRNYDIERENNLRLNGYNVIRFTGSQIYKNPYNCVFTVSKFLFEDNNDTIIGKIKEWKKEKGL